MISVWYLGTRYETEHCLGCVLIIMSGLASVLVNLQTNDPPLGEYAAPGGTLQQSSALWYVIFIIGTIPSGISNCYKQKCLKVSRRPSARLRAVRPLSRPYERRLISAASTRGLLASSPSTLR